DADELVKTINTKKNGKAVVVGGGYSLFSRVVNIFLKQRKPKYSRNRYHAVADTQAGWRWEQVTTSWGASSIMENRKG
ncbi:Unknown protein, partial [Striga hermonthica]